MGDAESTGGKQGRGRWRKGQSGNPRGRPAGSRNKATLAAEALLAGEAAKLTRKCIRMALAGDPVAMRLVMERICSPTKGRPVALQLPPIESVQDVLAAQALVVAAMSAGEITPDEAATISEVLEARRRTFEVVDMERRLVALESRKR